MSVILASLLRYYCPDGDGVRRPVALVNANGILDNIRLRIPHAHKLVCVANDPTAAEDNDAAAQLLARSFELAGLGFEKTLVLDGRNAQNAAAVCADASLIYLRGGKCVCQLEFLNNIGLREILLASSALILGVSAGAMNLGATVANFPEEQSDLPDPRRLVGLGITNIIFIPHFDGGACAYQFPCEHFDIAKVYILPMSEGLEFWCAANDGYILIDNNGKTRPFGDVCMIKNGKITAV